EREQPKGRIVETYDYTDEKGALLYQNARYEPKDFRQRQPDGKDGWIWNLNGCRRVPYRLPEIIAYPDAPLVLTEGEKDRDSAAERGACATTVGRDNMAEDCLKYFAGRDVWIVRDMDAPGAVRAHKRAHALHGTAKSVRIVELPGLDGTPGKKDLTDWFNLDPGNTVDRFAEVCVDTPEWTPDTAPAAATAAETATALPTRLALSSAEFVAGFTPPDYLIVGWLQRRFVYSLTAATGDGKTAIALLITLMISRGFKLGKLDFKCGRVLYFAGENPDDVRMRWLATTQQFGLAPEDIDNVYFVPGVFKFTQISERIREEMVTRELALVVVDTSAAYFETDDENNNMQALAHAKRLRELSRLPGGPTVLICCHPTKNAESLVPRGGGAFLNEVDGNLTCKRDDLAVELTGMASSAVPTSRPCSSSSRWSRTSA